MQRKKQNTSPRFLSVFRTIRDVIGSELRLYGQTDRKRTVASICPLLRASHVCRCCFAFFLVSFAIPGTRTVLEQHNHHIVFCFYLFLQQQPQ